MKVCFELGSEAVGDGVTDDTVVLQAEIDAGGPVLLRNGGTYRTTAPLVFPPDAGPIRVYSEGRATIKADHNGDCLDWTSNDSNYGGHSLERVNLFGPNTLYPADPGFVQPSTGAGLKMERSYYGVVRDSEIRGFLHGIRIRAGIKNTITGATYLRLNEHGLYLDGGYVNMNNFIGVGIRENHQYGVYMDGDDQTPGWPTHNVFDACLIESNNKYPYSEPSDAPNNNVGLMLLGGYENVFTNCWFENHDYAIWIGFSSDGNKFDKCRFSPGGNGSDKIMLDGEWIVNTTFTDCYTVLFGDEIPSVESNAPNQGGTQFINPIGMNFLRDYLVSFPDVINPRMNPYGAGVVVKEKGGG